MLNKSLITRLTATVTLGLGLTAGAAWAMNDMEMPTDDMPMDEMPIDREILDRRVKLPREWVWRKHAIDFDSIYGQKR